jgi:hypothetical protein
MELPENIQDTAGVEPIANTTPESLRRRLAREICAPLFWFYVLVKLFIFDFDVYIATTYFPGNAWLLSFRFLFIIGMLAMAWCIGGTQPFLLWLTYILFYPIILVFWKVPRFLGRQDSWNLIFACINALLSFVTSLKRTIITLAFLLSGVAIAIFSSSPNLLWIAIGSLFLVLVSMYARRFVLAFQPSSVYRLWTKAFAGVGKQLSARPILIELDLQNLPVAQLNGSQLQQWANGVQISILFNRVCLFAAKKLRDYQSSGLNQTAYLFSCILLLFVTVFSFAAINYAVYKIAPQSFRLTTAPTIFIFFYYSFEAFLFRSIPQIEASGTLSQVASMTETFFAFCLIGIIISLFFSVRNQKSTEALNSTIDVIKVQGEKIESVFKDQFQLSIKDAIAQLEKTNSGFLTIILYFTSRID